MTMKILLFRAALSALLVVFAVSKHLEPGDKFPKKVELDYGFPPEKIDIHNRIAGKKVIVVGLPGAFTPTW